MKRQNLRTVSLIVVTFTYLLFGAAIFGYLESEHELRQREALELIELIVKRKYNISEDDFTVLTTTVIKSVPHRAGIQWKFPGAFYFATTVVTTIGYGHSTPATMAGRSFCMIYALIGIPLGLVMFQSIGERLNTFVGAALRHAKRCFKLKNAEVTQTNLVMVVLVLSTILMTSMAAVFAKYERWEYFDALYYCFITLTTIGFGDYVALQKESALQSKPEYVILSLIFILFGLSVVSSAVNLLVLKFLTLNTEDERRDEQLRYTATLNPIQLEGDVITSAAGKLEYMRSDKSMSMQMAGHHHHDDDHRSATPPTPKKPVMIPLNNNNNSNYLSTNYAQRHTAEAAHSHCPPARTRNTTTTTTSGSSTGSRAALPLGVAVSNSPVSSSIHLALEATQQIRRRRSDHEPEQTTSIVEIHADEHLAEAQNDDGHCSECVTSSSSSSSSPVSSTSFSSPSAYDNHLHCDNPHHRRHCIHSRPHRQALHEHSSGNHLCDRHHRPHLHQHHLHRFHHNRLGHGQHNHHHQHHQQHHLHQRHRPKQASEARKVAPNSARHSNAISVYEPAARQTDGHLRGQQASSCAPPSMRMTTRGAQLKQRPLAHTNHKSGHQLRAHDEPGGRSCNDGNQTNLAPSCSCSWLSSCSQPPAGSMLEAADTPTNSCLVLNANNLQRQHLVASHQLEQQISGHLAHLHHHSTPTIGQDDNDEPQRAPGDRRHQYRLEPLAKEDGRSRRSNGDSSHSATTLGHTNRSTTTLNDDYRYYPPDAALRRDLRSSTSTTATTTGDLNRANSSTVVSPVTRATSSDLIANMGGGVGGVGDHDDDTEEDRRRRSRTGSQKSTSQATSGEHRSSGRQQSSAGSSGAAQTTTKLICKCCCQHEECIKHALESSKANKQADSSSLKAPNANDDNSDCGRHVEGHKRQASTSSGQQQQQQQPPPAPPDDH